MLGVFKERDWKQVRKCRPECAKQLRALALPRARISRRKVVFGVRQTGVLGKEVAEYKQEHPDKVRLRYLLINSSRKQETIS